MNDTPRTSNAWHEARHGENPNALFEEAQKLERELADATLARDEARSRYTKVVLNRDALREGVEKLAKEWEDATRDDAKPFQLLLTRAELITAVRELRALLK